MLDQICEQLDVVVNLIQLEKITKKMLERHKCGYNSMSDRVRVKLTKNMDLRFYHLCEYPECNPDVFTLLNDSK